jgi:CheY-like chemotaxis protein
MSAADSQTHILVIDDTQEILDLLQDLLHNEGYSVPRYRVEEHVPDQAAFIIGFADTQLPFESRLARRTAQLRRARVTADLVVIEQYTETVIRNGGVCM